MTYDSSLRCCGKLFLALLAVLVSAISCPTTALDAQEKKVEDFGFRHLTTKFQGEDVDIVIHSKKGEELAKKPLVIFIQGSLAKPLIKYSEKEVFGLFSFSNSVFEDKYHIAIVSKPGIPVVCHLDRLSKRKEFLESGKPPRFYTQHNNLEYFVERNDTVIKYLKTMPWVDTSGIVVMGHSEGSSIGARLAVMNKSVTHLIYSGGQPYFSRIASIVAQDRQAETADSPLAEKAFQYWEDVQKNPFDTSIEHGWNSYKGTRSFSASENEDLKKLKIPVLVSYGTKDTGCLFNDLFRIEAIEQRITNIDFKAYIGLEHNYFPLKGDGIPDYEQYNWDQVAADWLIWLSEKQQRSPGLPAKTNFKKP